MKKRLIMMFSALMMCGAMWAQGVLTVVYATSDDAFVNMRAKPTTKARVIEKLWMLDHGLGHGILREEKGKWSRVTIGDKEGWCLSKYVGKQTWYTGTRDAVLIATCDDTKLFRENQRDDDAYDYFGSVKKGTILADDFKDGDEYNAAGYYVLVTGHDFLFIPKACAEVITIRE